MKLAILLIGNYRTWPKTVKSFQKFINGNDVDLFVDTYDRRFMYHPVVSASIPKFHDELMSESAIIQSFSEFNLINITIRKSEESNNEFKMAKLSKKFKALHNNCYVPIKNSLESLGKIKQYEDDNNFKYDMVIKTRFDCIYASELDTALLKNCDIVLTTGNVYPNDWFFAGGIDNIFNLYQVAHDEFFTPCFENSHLNPPHGIFREILARDYSDVKCYRFVSGLLRQDGLVDNYVPKNTIDTIIKILYEGYTRIFRRVKLNIIKYVNKYLLIK